MHSVPTSHSLFILYYLLVGDESALIVNTKVSDGLLFAVTQGEYLSLSGIVVVVC